MAHPKGFEPLTDRVVADYSIQLSYGCVLVKKFDVAHPKGFEPLTDRFVEDYSIQLSYGCNQID